MPTNIRITGGELIALTDNEIELLRDVLNSGDRAGFYNIYAAMTGSEEADLQARIATFSYYTGGTGSM